MRRDLERRLRAVEASGSGEICVYQIVEGLVRCHGEQMPPEEAESRCRAAGKVAIFISEEDMNL